MLEIIGGGKGHKKQLQNQRESKSSFMNFEEAQNRRESMVVSLHKKCEIL